MGSTVERAWEAFLAAIAEAKELHGAGATAGVIQDLLQHARELLDIIDDEIARNAVQVSDEIRTGLTYMRSRLELLEGRPEAV